MQKLITVEQVRQNIIGFNTQILTLFGTKTCVYADHTATGKPFLLIEQQIQNHMKKMIANSHTEISAMGEYSTQLLDYAQDSILNSFGVDKNDYFAIPTGFGATGAFEKLQNMIPINKNKTQQEQPIVYISPYEHHSNILFWVENNCKVITIDSNDIGAMKLQFLEENLINNKDKIQIVTVSAASNVTSQKTDIKGINNIIKKIKPNCTQKIYFCLDCAALLSHDRIYLSLPDYDQIDFLSSSPHKNLGGSESTGLLIGKKSSYGLNDKTPTFPGGGTVSLVTGMEKQDIIYEKEIFFREQAGTPNALGFYRAALSFELEDQIGLDVIKFREESNQKYFIQGIKAMNKKFTDRKIVVYGENDNMEDRYDVFSFNILTKINQKHTMNYEVDDYKVLHPHFIAKILNDVYGLQVRSGCSCAGPFGVFLLQQTQEDRKYLQQQIKQGDYSQKPGWVRLDTFFAFEKYEIEYMLQAIQVVAERSDFIASQYINNNGTFVHKDQHKVQESDQFDFGLQSEYCNRGIQESPYEERKQKLQQQLELGKQIFGLERKHSFINKARNFTNKHYQQNQNINNSSQDFQQRFQQNKTKISQSYQKLNNLQKSLLNMPKKSMLPSLKQQQVQQAYQPWLGQLEKNQSNTSLRYRKSINYNNKYNNESRDTKDTSYSYYQNSNDSLETPSQKKKSSKNNLNNKQQQITGAKSSRVQYLQEEEDQKQQNLLNFINTPKQQKSIYFQN